MVVDEDADDSYVVEVPEPPASDGPYEDATEHAVRFYRVRPDWHCDECGTRNDGWRDPCGMCGIVRDDTDSLCG